MFNKEDLKVVLRKGELKVTTKRLDVLYIISNYEKAIPYSLLQSSLKDFDRVTLYRTIQALTENGIIHVAMQDDQETFYALCSSRCNAHQHHHNHIHFKCTICSTVSCIHLNKAIEFQIPNYLIDTVSVEVTGTCELCKD